MSAQFVRCQDDEGIEWTVWEPVSKMMLCMAFGLDKKEFIYILNEKRSIECSLYGSDDEFCPTKPGKYLVKKYDEVVSSKRNTESAQIKKEILERPLPEMEIKRIQTAFFNNQPDEIILKVLRKMDCQHFTKFAQTSEQTQKFIRRSRTSFDVPSSLFVQLGTSIPTIEIKVEKGIFRGINYRVTENGAFRDFSIKDANLLRPFRYNCVSIDATNSSLSPELLKVEYNFLIENGIEAQRLRAYGLNPSETAALARKLTVCEVVFIGDADGNQPQERRVNFESFVPEEFPDLNFLEISDTTFYEHCLKTEMFIRTVRKAEVVRFTTFFGDDDTVNQKFCPIFDKYLDNEKRGTNKFVQIKMKNIQGITINGFVRDLLDIYQITQYHESTAKKGHTVCLAAVKKYGHEEEFYVLFDKFRKKATFETHSLTVTFGKNNEYFCKELKKMGFKGLFYSMVSSVVGK